MRSNEPFHAARVNLFFANVADNDSVTITPTDMADAVDWFLAQEPPAKIVNVSISTGGDTLQKDEVLADWYARYHDVTFVYASGNGDQNTTVPTECTSLNTICVGGSSGTAGPQHIGDGLWTYEHQTLWNQTQWANTPGVEVEKPDLVAYAASSPVAAHDGHDQQCRNLDGTSFAAPIVTGYLALFNEYCYDRVPMSPLRYRALLRVASWLPHSFDDDTDPDTPCPATLGANPLFPTAAYGCDYKAGVGSLDTRNLMVFCGEPSTGCGETRDEPCIEQGEDDVAADDPRWQSIDDYPDLLTADAEEFLDNAYALTRQGPAPRVIPLHVYADLEAGTRLRFAFAYNSCPTRPSGGAFASVASVDFDVALCGKDATNDGESRCVFVSEPLHDTNEGFDVLVPVDLTDATLLVIGPPDDVDPAHWPPCDDGIGNRSRSERWFWAAALWGPGVWP